MEALFASLAVLAGALLAVQAGANTQLSKATGSPFAATALQLSVGAVILVAIALFTGTLSALAEVPDVPWWYNVAGVASAFYVVSTILLFPRLGAVVSVGLFIAGQMFASVSLDVSGWLGVPQQSLDAATVIGTIAVLVGVVGIVAGQAGAKDVKGVTGQLGWVLLALMAGAVLPIQGAVNGLLRMALGAPFTVGAISFVVATIAMALVLLFALAATDATKPHLRPLAHMPWWGWLGGIAGAIYVTSVFMSIPVIGTAATIGLTVAGQQLASMAVDRYGLMRLPQRPITRLRLAGVVLLLIGVALIQVF